MVNKWEQPGIRETQMVNGGFWLTKVTSLWFKMFLGFQGKQCLIPARESLYIVKKNGFKVGTKALFALIPTTT
jgi:hypothetical protein